MLAAHAQQQLPVVVQENIVLHKQLAAVALGAAIELQFGVAIGGLAQGLAVPVGAQHPHLPAPGGQLDLRAQVLHLLRRIAPGDLVAIGHLARIAVVVLSHRLGLQARAAVQPPLAAQYHAVACDVFALALRHVSGRHKVVVALHVVLAVAPGLQPETLAGTRQPFGAAGQLHPFAGVALAGPQFGPQAKAGIVQHIARQAQTPGVTAAGQAKAGVLLVGAGPLAAVVLAPVAAGIQLQRAAKTGLNTPRDDVHHTAHGSTAVLRRTGALDHFHALHIAHQVLAQVDSGAGAGRDRQAIDQHQHLVAAQALQRQLEARLAMHLAQLQAGHVLQRLLERAGAGALDFAARDHADWHRGLFNGALAARGTHHHGLQGGRVGRACRVCHRHRRHTGQQPQRRAKKKKRGRCHNKRTRAVNDAADYSDANENDCDLSN